MPVDENGCYNVDPTNDLLGLLLREFYKTQREGTDDPRIVDSKMESVEEFAAWARQWLGKNYVTGTYPVESGLAIMFKEGQRVPFTPQTERRMFDESIHITDPGPDRFPPNPREYAAVPITGR